MSREDEVKQAFMWHKTDKFNHGYAMIYGKVPKYIKSILEIGVGDGSSIRAWADLFQEAHIYAIDNQDGREVYHPRVKNIHCDIKHYQADEAFKTLDLIIDDGSHSVEDVLSGWNTLHTYCTGLYVIEDLGFEDCFKIVHQIKDNSKIISIIQTSHDDGSRAIVASFDKVIQW